MEGTIGLGFSSSHHTGAISTGATAFVSAYARDVNDEDNHSNSRDNLGVKYDNTNNNYDVNSSAVNIGVVAKEDGGSSSHIMHVPQQQLQQYNQQPQQQIQHSIPLQHPHPSTMMQSFHSHQPQVQPNPAMLPSTMPAHPVYSFPPHHVSMQPPPIIMPNPNSTIHQQQYSLPSFQPPPGLPPTGLPRSAAPSFPPQPSHVAHPVTIPPHRHSFPSYAIAAPSITSQHSQQKYDQTQQQQQTSDSLEKAQAIIKRFHQESTQITDSSIPANINYCRLRQVHFEKERRKLQTFKLKNLEYVMKHEEQELRKHVECMNQITAYEEKQQLQLQLQQQQQRQRQLQLDQRKQQMDQVGMISGGGIGTKDQKRAERVRKRQHYDSSSTKNGDNGKNESNKKKLRTSLYLTNLPIDGSTTERTLQSLFCLYGRLDRVAMYRHRSTGELKGDGLIVFGRDAAEEYQVKNEGDVDLVESVCTQMNGAELPGGTTIGVQPADMDYKKKSTNGEQLTQQTACNEKRTGEMANGTSDGANQTPNNAAGNDMKTASDAPKDDDDDDLDDFFASLE